VKRRFAAKQHNMVRGCRHSGCSLEEASKRRSRPRIV